MCDLVARTGRHQQRYDAGCRLVAGYTHRFFFFFKLKIFNFYFLSLIYACMCGVCMNAQLFVYMYVLLLLDVM